jgi:hypothetical protein
MRVLFYIRAVRQLRPYKSIFQCFSRHGVVVLAILDPRERRRTSTETLEEFKKNTPGFDYAFGHRRRHGIIRKVITTARELRTYRRYLLHDEQAAFYRERWKKFLPNVIQKIIATFTRATSFVIKARCTDTLLRAVEFGTPVVSEIRKQMLDFQPDVVCIGYRNLPSSAPDAEYLKTAKVLRIPTVIPVLSWDTLTTKGLIQLPPDKILVWNNEQVQEVISHHQLRKETSAVVGAYQFDGWLSYKTPTTTREEFCSAHGLRSEDPILLYFGFSYGIKDTRISGGHGPLVVEKLRRALDESSDTRLKKVQIIVRPHPMHTYQFANLSVRDAVVIPKTNTIMSCKEDFDLLFDSVYHSCAAIAINTTAIIDASIQMKPSIVLNWEEYKSVQGSTHFKRFLETGAVAISRTPADLAHIISGLLDGADPVKPYRENYFKKYIRPRGKHTEAAEYAYNVIKTLS